MTTTFPYLVVPGSLVQQLPGPNGTTTAVPSRAETLHTLLSGGMSKTQRPQSKRTYVLPYLARPGTGLSDLLTSFYEGLYDVVGTDFVYVNPAVVNVLSLDASTMGKRAGAALEWVASSGSLVTTTSQTAPVAGSGVLQWTAAASSNLEPGVAAAVANVAKAPVYLPGEPVTVSIYLKGSGTGSVTLVLAGFDATGATNSTSITAACSLTTSWQRFTVSAAAGAGGLASSVFVLPRVTTGASGFPATVYAANAQIEYASAASGWVRGYGSPRVIVSATPGWSADRFDGYTDHTLSLAEV